MHDSKVKHLRSDRDGPVVKLKGPSDRPSGMGSARSFARYAGGEG